MPASRSANNQLEGVEWRLHKTAPGAYDSPQQLSDDSLLGSASVPGTVAQELTKLAHNQTPLPPDLDAHDWWYQCDFDASTANAAAQLHLEGLATIAEVWLNDKLLLTSRDMFVGHVLDISDHIGTGNTLSIAFRSLQHDLGQRRPRGRWKTNLVESQQLRWIRTTLLGRIPGWTPPIQAVGPWREVRLETGPFSVLRRKVRPFVRDQQASIEIELQFPAGAIDGDASEAVFTLDGRSYELKHRSEDDRDVISGELQIDDIELWWPHTEGTPNRYAYSIDAKSNGKMRQIDAGNVGFRSVSFNTADNSPAVTINGAAVSFCRGFCWTTADIVTLRGDRESLRASLTIARDAGANMIRIGGTMVYESDDFYDLCDELGLMVWQDFMFANMDYPIDDEDFSTLVEQEIEQQSRRLSAFASVVAYCGNSEVEQQAAMFGQTADVWSSPLFYKTIPEILAATAGDTPYFPSSPTGGALPFHNRSGISHYFGVGAYKRPLADAATAGVLFTTECLGFSNIPSQEARREHFGANSPFAHSPQWKAGVPRDSAAGWDFEDIRDHYLQELYGHDAAALRYCDNDAYIATSTAVTGDVMEATFKTWMHTDNPCRGALIWFMKDLVPGAGWGFIDSDNRPKPLFYYLRRAWAANSLAFVDRGLDGLFACLSNSGDSPWVGSLELQMLRQSSTAICKISVDLEIAPGEQREICIDEELGRFYDTTYSYRFGPPKHDVTVAAFKSKDKSPVATVAHFPNGHGLRELGTANIVADCDSTGDESTVRIRSDVFLQRVELTAKGYQFSDNYFHLPPDTEVVVNAQKITDSKRAFRGELKALNLGHSVILK
ncbi:MAG: glycoside hydrolase family 2 protein [Gammaproteobacteria bacterium]|nr:glycoside hydrolase family 2 protein [Gammaproteobacteria bacterium]